MKNRLAGSHQSSKWLRLRSPSLRFIIAILSLSVSASAATPPLAADLLTRSPSSVTHETIPLDGEEALVAEIDRQADAIFTELKRQQPDFSINSFQHAERAAVYQLRQLHVLTDILKATGPAPATALVATELLTNFVLAPLLAARGETAAAGIALTVPWGLVAAVGVASYDVMKMRFQIAHELGITSMSELDRIRKIVIGYDIRHRVSSAIYHSTLQEVARDKEFDILKSNIDADSAQIPFMSIRELETLIRSEPRGAVYLDQIYLEKVDSELYVALMLRYLDESPQLTEQLLTLLQAREPQVTENSNRLRHHLIALDDLRKQIARDIKGIQEDLKDLKRAVKEKTVSAEFEKAEKRRFASATRSLQKAREFTARHEYALLQLIHVPYLARNYEEVDRLAHEFEGSLAVLRNASRYQHTDLEKHPLLPLLPISQIPQIRTSGQDARRPRLQSAMTSPLCSALFSR